MSIKYKFYSWFSASDAVWKDWTYIYSENINTFNPEFIQLSPKCKNLFKTNEKIECLIPAMWGNTDFFHYIIWNKIFNQNHELQYEHATKTAPLPPNSSFSKDIEFAFSLWPGNSFVIYWSIPDIKDETKFSWRGIMSVYTWDIYQRKDLNLPKEWVISYVLDWWYLFLTRNYAFRYQINEGSLNDKPPALYWVFISDQFDWFKIYTKDWKLKLLDWNMVTKQAFYLNISIYTACLFLWVDYIFSEEWLFFLNWIIASVIIYKNKSNYLNFQKLDFHQNPKFGVVRSWKFIYSVCKTDKWLDICALWTEVVWSPINFSSVVSKPWQEVTSMIPYNSGVLISYRHNDWHYGIDYFTFKNEEKEEVWYIITKEYVNDNISKLKFAKKIELYCDQLQDWEYIKLYTSINNSPFEHFSTITKNSRWKNWLFTVYELNREFHKIVFKIEIKWNFKLYDFIFYDETKK